MNLFDTFRRVLRTEQRGNPLENPATPLGQGMDYLMYMLGGEPTASGEPVSESTALQIATVYACVASIARDVGTIPLYVYERTAAGHRRADDVQLADLLNVEPHPDMSAASFKEAVTSNLVLTGNGYAEITWNGAGQPVMLTPRIATKTQPIRMPNGDLAYRCTDTDTNGRIVAASDMLHIPALAMDGILGLNPIRQMRQTLGLATASEKAAARLFGNGVLSTGILTMPAGLSNEQKAQLRQSFEESTRGPNQMRPVVVPADAKFQPLTINPVDAQFLESRKYSREEICSIFGVPPHKVGILERATNNNIEHQGIEYVTATIRPVLVRWEQEIQRKLMPRIGRNSGRYFVRFDVSELLRGDQASTSAYYAAALQWGWMNRNEVREKEGMNAIGKAGDVFMSPLNMVNVEQMLNVQKPDPAPSQKDDSSTPDGQPDSTVGDPVQERMIDTYGRTYRLLFRDAVGRLFSRSTKDSEAITRAFEPVLSTLADQSIRDANSSMRSKLQPVCATQVVSEYLRNLEKRVSKIGSDDPDSFTESELPRAIKSIVLGIYREAGATLASVQ